MAKKVLNERCPLSVECERKKCEHIGQELDCDYYHANAREELVIEDQERLREERWRQLEEQEMADMEDDEDEEDTASKEQSAEAGKMVFLPVDQLHPHPDNPRKELGDLSELAESIKTNGIFQNLTVVPGHIMSEDEFAEMAKAEGGTKAAARGMYDRENAFVSDGYMVVIGHRRCAAAKLAGLTHVPCVIVEMTPKEQVQTMLLENMQRSDLTVYEQAQGFQMMLDMGSSLEEIVEKSGFSKTTVRRRLEMAKLDSKTLQKVSGRQLTLGDFDELAKVDDLGTRNKLLKSMGTANFQNELKSALEEQRVQKRIEEWLPAIQAFATEDPNASYSTHKYVRGYSKYRLEAEVETPEDADTVKYVYKLGKTGIDLYAERDTAKEDAEKAEREERERVAKLNREEREDVNRRHFELRRDFIKGISITDCKKTIGKIAGLVTDVMWDMSVGGYNGAEIDTDLLSYVLGVKIEEEDAENAETLTDIPGIRTALEAFPEKTLLALAYSSFDSPSSGYWRNRWNGSEYVYGYDENGSLDMVYDILEAFGYEMSDEEEQAKNGTHPLFPKEKKEEDPCTICKSAHPSCDKCCNACDTPCNAGQACRKENEVES